MTDLSRLRGREGVVLDTMVFVYFFEDTPGYADPCEALLTAMSGGAFRGVVTPITTAELLVKPLRENRGDLAARYRNALAAIPNLTLSTVDHDTAAMAGALRAKYALPLPDMLQVAAALRYARPALVTNDRALLRVSEVDIFLLTESGEKSGTRKRSL